MIPNPKPRLQVLCSSNKQSYHHHHRGPSLTPAPVRTGHSLDGESLLAEGAVTTGLVAAAVVEGRSKAMDGDVAKLVYELCIDDPTAGTRTGRLEDADLELGRGGLVVGQGLEWWTISQEVERWGADEKCENETV